MASRVLCEGRAGCNYDSEINVDIPLITLMEVVAFKIPFGIPLL